MSSSNGSHLRNHQDNPEWYEMVDKSVRHSLDKTEVKRQGLWWEVINGEREYVRDLRVVCEVSGPSMPYGLGIIQL